MEATFRLPVEFAPGSNVLVAGAGGGFDVVCGLPVALALREAGCRVHLANYSFTHLSQVGGATQPMRGLYGVDAGCTAPSDGYCPEAGLATWWAERFGEDRPVWCFDRLGVRPVSEAYAYLGERLDLQGVVVLDAGVDGLFVGDEFDMATPSMDAVSILAAATLTDVQGIYAFTAFGTEGRGYQVRHADALRRMSELVFQGAMLGAAAAVPGSSAGKLYREALEAIHLSLPEVRHSIMASSLAYALDGSFGEVSVTPKTVESPVWVSPLTLLFWFFDLEAVAAAKPYREKILLTDTVHAVADAIERVRRGRRIRVREDIPI